MRDDDRVVSQVRLLTGRALDYDVVCEDCAEDAGSTGLIEICEGCAERIAEDAADGSLSGWRGQPGVGERPEPVDPTVTEWVLPDGAGDVIDLVPGAPSTWLALTGDGRILALTPAERGVAVVASVALVAEPGHEPFEGHALRHRLHASPGGRFAAVVNDYGRYGAVVDLERGGAVTLELDGGDYHPETVPFALAFTRHGDRIAVIHRTAWNRLDVSDAETGQLLTPRTIEPITPGSLPEHHLDYFHGRLHLSPDGRWIADDGWIWHPTGVPLVWDLRAWLDGATWEAEDGPSMRWLPQRDSYWNVPMCFVGTGMLAVSGIGSLRWAMLPGVRIFAAASGDEVTAFAGPTGALFADRTRLYSAEPDGLHIWDPVTGHRTGRVPGITPSAHDRRGGFLIEVGARALRWWRAVPVPAGR